MLISIHDQRTQEKCWPADNSAGSCRPVLLDYKLASVGFQMRVKSLQILFYLSTFRMSYIH